MKNIIVCVKIVPKPDEVFFDPEKKVINRANADSMINEADKNAIEHAVRLKERYGGKVVLLSMGPPMFDSYLKLGMAMGADEAVLLSDRAFAGSDTIATAMALAGAIRKIGDYDLVILGDESSDGGTGQVHAQVAELLDVPQILYATDLDVVGSSITAKRTVKGGEEIVKAESPVLVSTQTGSNQPRFPNFKQKKIVDADYKVPVWTLKDLDITENDTGMNGSYTIVNKLVESESPERLRKFIKGTPEEQARQIMEIMESEENF